MDEYEESDDESVKLDRKTARYYESMRFKPNRTGMVNILFPNSVLLVT
jgi:hypothetical protein